MEMIVYLKVKDEELNTCKEFAYIDGKEEEGQRYYVVESELLNISHPLHASCTCKVVVVNILNENEEAENDSDFVEDIKDSDNDEEKKLMARYDVINKSYNKQNFKLAEGQDKPTSINGWKEVIVGANIQLLDRVTKNARQKTYEMLP